MEAIFGELLYKEPVQDGRRILPSPASLKRKILVKVSHAAQGIVPLWQRALSCTASNRPFMLTPSHSHTLTPSHLTHPHALTLSHSHPHPLTPSPSSPHRTYPQGKKLMKALEALDNDEGEVSDEDEAADMDPVAIKKAGVELEEAKPEVGGV